MAACTAPNCLPLPTRSLYGRVCCVDRIAALVGILIGLLVRWPSGLVAIRACGLLVALAGCYFLYEHGST